MNSLLMQAYARDAAEAFGLIMRGVETYENFSKLSTSIKRKNALTEIIKKLNVLEAEIEESLNNLARTDLTDDMGIEILDIVFRIHDDLNKLTKEIKCI